MPSAELPGIALLMIALAGCGSSSDGTPSPHGADASSSPDGTSPPDSSSIEPAKDAGVLDEAGTTFSFYVTSNGTEMPSALLNCEDQWTMNATAVEVSPPEGRLVAAALLFDPNTNACSAMP
jgi:hypothetical protein